MNVSLNSKTSIPILVFNPMKRFVGYFHSITAAARAFKVTSSAIHQACTGSCISCGGLYFRFLDSSIELEDCDYGTLRLEDYDSMCGIKRVYYPTAEMTRKGMKYKQESKNIEK